MNAETPFCTNRLAVIGEGRRRICYRMRAPDLCAKFYRAPSQFRPGTAPRVRLLIGLARSSHWLNVNRQEWRYHQQLQRRLPADLLSVFPEQVEPIYSADLGWGVVESLILNTDGAPARKVSKELPRITDPALRLRVYRETERLLARFAEHGVRFYDLSNLLLQWTGDGAFRLRVADFEPCCRGVPALLSRCRWYSSLKTRRRAARFLARLRQDLFVSETPRPAASRKHAFWNRGLRLFARRVGLI